MADTPVHSETVPEYIQNAREHGIHLRQSAPIHKGPLPIELPIIEHLRGKRVILASASPRRKALLEQVGLTDLEIIPSTKPEDLPKTSLTPHEYVLETARRKCLDVYAAACAAQAAAAAASPPPRDPALVLAADTVIVTAAGRILEKPRSAADHGAMLRHLRATRAHRVLTAVVALAPRADARHPGYALAAHVEATRVVFARAADGLSDAVLAAYVRSREGADKAGGYALQGVGGLLLVDRVEGCVDNVVGLPVRRTLALAEKVIFRQDEEEVPSDEENDDDDEGAG